MGRRVVIAVAVACIVVGRADALTFTASALDGAGNWADDHDADPGNVYCSAQTACSGFCTLRAAIEEANQVPGPDTVVLADGEYHVFKGDIEITDDLTITTSGTGTCNGGANSGNVCSFDSDCPSAACTGKSEATILHTGTNGRIFTIAATGKTINIDHVVLSRGEPGTDGGILTLNKCAGGTKRYFPCTVATEGTDCPGSTCGTNVVMGHGACIANVGVCQGGTKDGQQCNHASGDCDGSTCGRGATLNIEASKFQSCFGKTNVPAVGSEELDSKACDGGTEAGARCTTTCAGGGTCKTYPENSRGGGIFNGPFHNGGILSVRRVDFEQGQANWGGAIFNAKGGVATIENVFYHSPYGVGGDYLQQCNDAWGDQGGGGSSVANFGTATLRRNSFYRTQARLGNGGAVLNCGWSYNGDPISFGSNGNLWHPSVCDGILTIENSSFIGTRCRKCAFSAISCWGGTIDARGISIFNTQNADMGPIGLLNGCEMSAWNFAMYGSSCNAESDPATEKGDSDWRCWNCYTGQQKSVGIGACLGTGWEDGSVVSRGRSMDDGDRVPPHGDPGAPIVACVEGSSWNHLDLASFQVYDSGSELPTEPIAVGYENNAYNDGGAPFIVVPEVGFTAPMINGGETDCGLSTDQRGKARPLGGSCDFGAIEMK